MGMVVAITAIVQGRAVTEPRTGGRAVDEKVGHPRHRGVLRRRAAGREKGRTLRSGWRSHTLYSCGRTKSSLGFRKS